MRYSNLPGLFVLTFALPAFAQPAIIPETGHSYFLTPQRASWHEAREYAQSVGGYLASIQSAEEQDWISVTFGATADHLWIGFTDELLEGEWRWENGKPVSFTAWAPGEPNDYPSSPTGEDYAVMDNRAGWDGLWFDYPSPLYGTTPVLYFGLVETCAADLNLDGMVDFADYLVFLNLYNAQDPGADFTGDGLVDFSDYLAFLNYYANSCQDQ